MLNRNTLTVAWAACLVAGLALGAGCKKGDKSSKKSGGDMSAMNAMDMGKPAPEKDDDKRKAMAMQPGGGSMAVAKTGSGGTTAATTPAPQGQAGALPLPHDIPAIFIGLKAARGHALFKQYKDVIQAKLTEAMNKNPVGKAILADCKVNPIKDVDSVHLGIDIVGRNKGGAMVIKGTFDTSTLIPCLSKALGAGKVTTSEVKVGKASGISFKMKGQEFTVVGMSKDTLLVAGGAVRQRALDVYTGKTGGITGTAFYKKLATKMKPETVIGAVVPVVKIGAGGGLAALGPFGGFLSKIKAGGLVLSLPAGGLDANITVVMKEAEAATKMAALVPMLVNMAKSRKPELADLVKNLKATTNGAELIITLVLDKAGFDKLQKLIKDQLKGLIGGAGKASPPKP